MVTRRLMLALAVAGGTLVGGSSACKAQCCLDGLFAGCASCFRKAPPAYAVAPMAAPIPAPPPPVMVPVQQVSYVPETTYQTKYECVPVTSYKPSCEVDPCTGCTRECMEQVVNYQQRPVSVPVTQYRAVYSTKYVQMQPGYGAPAAYPAPAAPPAFTAPAPAPAASSPFAAPVQTAPQGWGAAGPDVPQQLIPGQPSYAAPALPPMTAPQPTFQQQIVPQGGTFAAPAPTQAQLQPTAPPALSPAPVSPAPSLKPIPELPKTAPQNGAKAATAPNAAGNGTGVGNGAANGQPSPSSPPSLAPIHPSAAPAAGTGSGAIGMPVMPGPGPSPATNAFPKLLEPTSHTTQYQPAYRPLSTPATSWQPATVPPAGWQPTVPAGSLGAYASPQRPGGYPTAALPIRSQQ